MTSMPSIRRLWTVYKQKVLRGYGIADRSHAQLIAHNAFYYGAFAVLQSLASLLERGDVEDVHRFIEHQGRQLRAMRGARPRARRH